VVIVGALLPASPNAGTLGFGRLPAAFFAALVGMVITYLLLIEIGKRYFYRVARVTIAAERRPYSRARHVVRRAARFSS
jgi:Mg2+-importing ATPase